MKKINLIISKCSECPYLCDSNPNALYPEYFCSRHEDGIEIQDENVIDPNCQLEDVKEE